MYMRQNYRMSHFIIGWFNTSMFHRLRSSALLKFHPPIWCEHKYWNSCLTGLSKWSAVSCCMNSSGIKSRECVVSVISITSVFWILHSMMTHTSQDEDEGADFERKASNLDAKRKEKRSPPATPATNKYLIDWENNSSWWQTNHKTWENEPKKHVCNITKNFQKAGVMLWQSTVQRILWHRTTDATYTARCKPLTSTKNSKARLEFAKKHKGEPEKFWNCVCGPMRQRWTFI